ncbi:UBX domain-containing protein 11 isoform X4 [Heterocephalus glaber]|uniref:UBX domain-containing protein 11 n=1 Tax=Heterocephalus glaber TaxID=10181 RepID=A0AAX6TG35_HETGA|nr:UBX domain-containing protein 11 isoform X4 [Heterocephalus glaber]
MSSPLASLSKTRKVPLQSEPVNPGRRGIRIYGDEDEVDMLNDGHGSEERIAVPSCYGGVAASVRSQGESSLDLSYRRAPEKGPAFPDPELLVSMRRKLQELEQQVQAQTDEMLSKDQKILALEELVKTLQQHQGEETMKRQEELETLCVQLQRQVGEMEQFLSDYGLQWVGEPMDQENSEDKTVSEDDARDWMTAKKFWKPGDSLVPPEVDFDRLLASLKDLSELVVEGDTQVIPVPGGARLHALEPIPLKLYRNGIMMFDGPFRPFHNPATQLALPFHSLLQCCLRDILDGFFPSELQRLYPSGVPFKVSDLRDQAYPEDGLGPFPGEGCVVGWQRMLKASDRVPEHPGMTAEKFLNRLPKFVIRQGEVIDIRGPIRDALQEIIVETPALAAEQQRSQESPNTPAPPLCMLRVKSENGEQAFLLMMRPEDTVGTVRALLAQARAVDAPTFEIFSTFPPTVYQDDALTLQDTGLMPSAMLLMRACRAQLPNPGFGPSLGSGPSPE